MSAGDRFNRLVTTMKMLAEDHIKAVLAVRLNGVIYEFRLNATTQHLESDTYDQHARTIIDDSSTRFVEGYPGRSVDQALSAVW